jgi:ATPase subunit of ABC transporter with duplicated ATPase domains
MPSAVVVAALRKTYGAVTAVQGVSFAVERGEIFALLGPNGAGKTTTLEICEGFRARDAGLPPAAVLAVTSAATLDGDGLVTVETAAPTQALHELTGWALRHDAALGRLTVDRPSLEEVYLRLTSDADVPDQVKEKSTP